MQRTFWIAVLAFIAGLLLGLGLRGCAPTAPAAPVKQPIAWVPKPVQDSLTKATPHDTTLKAEVTQRVSIKKHYVPRVASDLDKLAKYATHTKDLDLVARVDSGGLTVDSISLTNRQSILVMSDVKTGSSTISIENSSPYMQNANVKAFEWRMPVYERVTYGI